MTRVDVAALSLRLAGLYVWMTALGSLPALGLWFGGRSSAEIGDPRGYCVGLFLIALLGTLLFFGAPRFARRLFPDALHVRAESPVPAGSIAFLIAGIIFLERAIEQIPQVAVAKQMGAEYVWALPAITACLALAAIGIWLVLAREWFARRLFAPDGSSQRPDLAHVQQIAIAVVGLWILAEAVPYLITQGASALSRGDEAMPVRLRVEDWTTAGRAFLGLCLVLGSRGITAALSALHPAGDKQARARAEPRENG
jgi:hypothetical protein